LYKLVVPCPKQKHQGEKMIKDPLDPLADRPEERIHRIEAIRKQRFGEPPDSDLNVLLFAYDEARREIESLKLAKSPALSLAEKEK
jgi:hypothetical protein